MSERIVVTLAPESQGPPVDIRLRHALKQLLRQHGLRAVDVQRYEHRGDGAERASVAANASNGHPVRHGNE